MKYLLSLGVFVASIVPAQACTIPVFRYALEKWDLTPYEVLVYHRGPLPKDTDKELKRWTDARMEINLDVTLVDLDANMSATQEKLWKRDGDVKQTPWMIVRYFGTGAAEPSAWKGPCTAANLRSLVDSPMRQTIIGHLSRGASVVYVLLKSGDAKADQAALKMAAKELADLEKKIKLPVQSETGPKIRLPLPLKVELPLLVLDRTTPQEADFVRLLLNVEEDLDKIKGPILYPIFGRGRALGGLYGKELNPDILFRATQFLCKECSCQVKELNPGVDLIIHAHWNNIFDRMFDKKETTPLRIEPAKKSSRRSDAAPAGEGNPQPTLGFAPNRLVYMHAG